MQHMDVGMYFLCKLIEYRIFEVQWIPIDVNSSNLFTENLDGLTYEKHTTVYIREWQIPTPKGGVLEQVFEESHLELQ